jgi:hypothetical protein
MREHVFELSQQNDRIRLYRVEPGCETGHFYVEPAQPGVQALLDTYSWAQDRCSELVDTGFAKSYYISVTDAGIHCCPVYDDTRVTQLDLYLFSKRKHAKT